MDAAVGDLELPQNAAHLALSLDGRFVYASNRGPANKIVVYEMDATGRLRYAGSRASGGINPKAFAVTEKFVVVANQVTLGRLSIICLSTHLWTK
jgi:6-phosphogluconolactonase (cycloisomerase 2 family)